MNSETFAETAPARRPRRDFAERERILGEARRMFFGAAALLGLAAAALAFVIEAPAGRSAWVAALFAALAAASVAMRRLPARWHAAAMTALIVADSAALALAALVFGDRVAEALLGALGVLACVLCAAVGRRAGFAVAIFQAVCLVAVYQAPALGIAPSGVVVPRLAGLAVQLFNLAIGLAGGITVAYVLSRHIRAAADREHRFQRLLALASDAYWEIDAQHRLVGAADRAGAASSLTPETGLGQLPWNLPGFHADPETLDQLLADLQSREPFRDRPVRWDSAERGRRHMLASGEPRFDERGRFTGFWGVVRDVTEAHQARTALTATEGRYRELFTLSPAALVLHQDFKVLDANPAALELFGHASLAAMRGADLLAAYEPGESLERARRRATQLMAQPLGTALPMADFQLRIGGRSVAVRGTGALVEADGTPVILSIFVDESERRAAEQAVRSSQALLSNLVATSPDAIVLTDLDSGRYTMVNQAFERMLGWTAAEVIGRRAVELGVWESPAAREAFVRQLREHGSITNQALRLVTRAGTALPMVASAARFKLDEREFAVTIARDISASEAERRERETILANASVGIAVTRERRFVHANRHFEAIFGWGVGELVGQPGRVVWPSDEAYAWIAAQYGPALQRGEPIELETDVCRKDGSTFPAQVRAHAVDPARHVHGGTVWIVEDITARRAAEQALQRARTEAEAANQAKSAFLANTNHELRTPLNGIIGLARLARDAELDEATRRQYLEQIGDSAQALADTISDILDVSKIEAGALVIESVDFDLGEVLQSLQSTYAPLVRARGLQWRCDVAPGGAGTVRGDALRVRQIVSNFLSNAQKFTEQGSITLRAFRPGGSERVRFEVQDTGRGIDAAARGRLFQPFTQADESTTRRYGGTGLGLSICRQFATLMGGTVGVESQPGAGSLFWAELPLPAAEARDIAPAEDAAELRGLRVLLVEDNAVNMLIATAQLQRWGVQVEAATHGGEVIPAVERAAAAGRPFNAVLMDLQMPVMSGHEATRRLRELPCGKHLPIVALTAAALVEEREHAIAAGMNAFLTKPIDPRKLRETLLRFCASDAAAA